MKISSLPIVTENLSDTKIVGSNGGSTVSISLDTVAEQVKKMLGYLEKPLIKCSHCGQWGAAYCACRTCGAPIDPA